MREFPGEDPIIVEKDKKMPEQGILVQNSNLYCMSNTKEDICYLRRRGKLRRVRNNRKMVKETAKLMMETDRKWMRSQIDRNEINYTTQFARWNIENDLENKQQLRIKAEEKNRRRKQIQIKKQIRIAEKQKQQRERMKEVQEKKEVERTNQKKKESLIQKGMNLLLKDINGEYVNPFHSEQRIEIDLSDEDVPESEIPQVRGEYGSKEAIVLEKCRGFRERRIRRVRKAIGLAWKAIKPEMTWMEECMKLTQQSLFPPTPPPTPEANEHEEEREHNCECNCLCLECDCTQADCELGECGCDDY